MGGGRGGYFPSCRCPHLCSGGVVELNIVKKLLPKVDLLEIILPRLTPDHINTVSGTTTNIKILMFKYCLFLLILVYLQNAVLRSFVGNYKSCTKLNSESLNIILVKEFLIQDIYVSYWLSCIHIMCAFLYAPHLRVCMCAPQGQTASPPCTRLRPWVCMCPHNSSRMQNRVKYLQQQCDLTSSRRDSSRGAAA